MIRWSCRVTPTPAGGGLGHLAGHFDVGARRRRIARRVVVDQDQGTGAQVQGALDHLARIDRGVIDGAALLHLVGDQHILAVEEEQPHLFRVFVLHRHLEIVQQPLPGAEHRTLQNLFPQHPFRRHGDDGQGGDRRRSQPAAAGQLLGGGPQHPAETAELGQ